MAVLVCNNFRGSERKRKKRRTFTHSALVWLLSCMSAHVDHQHVLGFERSLLSRALLPVTHKLLFLSMDVLIVDMLNSTQIKQNKSVGGTWMAL